MSKISEVSASYSGAGSTRTRGGASRRGVIRCPAGAAPVRARRRAAALLAITILPAVGPPDRWGMVSGHRLRRQMPTVAIDARDARAPDPRGWGRYARELIGALRRLPGIDLREHAGGGPAPELLWEQVSWPLRLAGERPDVVHAPNCFLPLRRPCPGVVTVHDLAFEVHGEDFSARTGWKYRTFTPRSVRSAERVICVSAATAADVAERYRADPQRLRVVPNAPALAIGDAPLPSGAPYLLAVGDLRAKKNVGRLVDAWEALRGSGELPEHRLVLAGADVQGRGAGYAARGAEVTGYVDDAMLDALMRGADLLVHPSL